MRRREANRLSSTCAARTAASSSSSSANSGTCLNSFGSHAISHPRRSLWTGPNPSLARDRSARDDNREQHNPALGEDDFSCYSHLGKASLPPSRQSARRVGHPVGHPPTRQSLSPKRPRFSQL